MSSVTRPLTKPLFPSSPLSLLDLPLLPALFVLRQLQRKLLRWRRGWGHRCPKDGRHQKCSLMNKSRSSQSNSAIAVKHSAIILFSYQSYRKSLIEQFLINCLSSAYHTLHILSIFSTIVFYCIKNHFSINVI